MSSCAGVSLPADVTEEGHDVPTAVLTDVVHWLRRCTGNNPGVILGGLRRRALEGHSYCYNAGCEVKAYTRPLISLT